MLENRMLGNNLAGENNILGAHYAKKPEVFIKKNKKHFATTPVSLPDAIPRGKYEHIGDGVWLHRCSYCDDFALTYGTIVHLSVYALHETSHGIPIAGSNSFLPPTTRDV